jgi:hypothetical protein
MSESDVRPAAMVTFVLRFWHETSAGQLRYRGQIEHVQTRRRCDFLEIQDLLGFLEGFGIGSKAPPAAGWTAQPAKGPFDQSHSPKHAKERSSQMTSAETLNGAKNAFTFFDAYLSVVAEEIGMERAVALDTKMCEMMGAAQGKAISDETGMGEVDLATAASLAARSIDEGLGISSKVIEASTRQITFAIGRCPLYEAAEALGTESAAIEATCRAGALRYMDSMVKQWNPRITYRLREFRPSAGGHCVEEVVLS